MRMAQCAVRKTEFAAAISSPRNDKTGNRIAPVPVVSIGF